MQRSDTIIRKNYASIFFLGYLNAIISLNLSDIVISDVDNTAFMELESGQ